MVPDYYVMLGIDVRADRPEIEAALERGRHRWSAGTRNPKYKHTYQSYLDQVPDVRRRLLGDPSARAAYDAELLAAAIEAKGRTLDALHRLVRLRAAKGGLTVVDRSLLLARAVGLGLTADDLARLVEPYPTATDAPAPSEPDEPADDALDPVTRRQIGTALGLVAKADLYDALGLPRDAAGSEVIARADSERQRWMRKSQVTAEKTAWLEVVSYVQSHLVSPEGRARYDRGLVLEAEEDFGRSVAFAIEGLTAMDPGTRSVLLDEAAARGLLPDRAERMIARACRASGVSRDGATVTPAALPGRTLRCRSCGGLTDYQRVGRDPDRAACRHCGASIRWACPVCRSGHWVDEPRCRCGFGLRNLEPLLRHFEASNVAYRDRDYDAALDHLGRVREFAPGLVGARKAVEKVKARLAEIAARKADFELARGRGHLLDARGVLLAWAALVDPASPPLLAAQEELVARLREAHGFVRRAKALEPTDPAAARVAYRQAIAIAADLHEANEGLRGLPPDAPTGLSATVETDGVALRWTPPRPDGLGPWTFRAIRKAGAVPTSPADGAVAVESQTTEALDRGATPGRSFGYAVFTCRGGALSLSGATAGPIAVLPDVAHLRAEGGRGQIALSWALPSGATGAKVVRLSGPGGTDRSVEAMADEAIDAVLDDGRIYRYRVSAVFRGDDGRPVASPGVEIAATPTPPAAPAGPLRVRPAAEGGLLIEWPAVPRGTVKVLRSREPPGLAIGGRIGSRDALELDGQWLDVDGPDGTADPDPPMSGACSYTPFVFLNGTATAGASVAYSSVPDPSDLRAVRAGGGRVHLRWRWPPKATGSIVVAKLGSPPDRTDDPGSVATRVGEVDYSRQGYASIALPAGGGPWHLAVFSAVTVDGSELTSPGLEPTARTIIPGPNPEVTIRYALRRPSFPGRLWSISLQTDPPGSSTPPLALVAHPRTVPLSVDDGQIVERFPAAMDGASFPVRPRVDLTRHRARLFADPAADPTGYPPIRFRHPESAGTRV